MTKQELDLTRIKALGLDKTPNMKQFFRVLILFALLVALCIAWGSNDVATPEVKKLSYLEYLHPTDDEINVHRLVLADARETLTDTDCEEIDAEMEAWYEEYATHELQDDRERMIEENGIVAGNIESAERYAARLDQIEGNQR